MGDSRHSHIERHFLASATVRDVVIGMADGLTVPFALAAGLAATVSSSRVVVIAGLAEIAAGALAMGLGGWLAARTDAEHYDSEHRRETHETHEMPERERAEIAEIFHGYGLSGEPLRQVVNTIAADRERWVDFMMRFELGLERPDPGRAAASALTIGLAYLAGGLVPLLPYMVVSDLARALPVSVVVTLAVLLGFGALKGRLTGVAPLKAGLQTMGVGGLAAAAAFAVVWLVGAG
jgi:VIT1/CCC1 family predicted Fe2+/Mn2+ transporter